MKPGWKIVLIILGVGAVGAVILFMINRALVRNVSKTTQESSTAQPSKSETTKLNFTHPMFDPSVVTNITPLGELNGGYSEAQAMAGVMINLKPSAVAGGATIPVIAPADMTLDYYSYFESPVDKSKQWTLLFRLSPQHLIRFDHISDASQKIIDATTLIASNSSAEQSPKTKIKFKAGEEFARTSGTVLAHNWNIYLFETGHKNPYVNQERFMANQTAQRMLAAVCPFDYYDQTTKASYYALLGYSKAGQSTRCGNPSQDKAGTIAGQWYLSADPTTGVNEIQEGDYFSPIAIYKNSAGEIILDHFGGKRIDIPSTHAAAKDPQTITTQHCYQSSNGYVFVELKSETQLAVAYARSGACPTSLPVNHKLYYR